MSFFRAGLTQTNAVLADVAMVLRLVNLVVDLVMLLPHQEDLLFQGSFQCHQIQNGC